MKSDEREDFENICKKYGYQPGDFILTDHDNPTPAGAIAPLSRIVIVQRTIKREYQGGHDTSWLANFEIDLRNGFFKNR